LLWVIETLQELNQPTDDILHNATNSKHYGGKPLTMITPLE